MRRRRLLPTGGRMSLARSRARRAVHAYARKLGVDRPVVIFKLNTADAASAVRTLSGVPVVHVHPKLLRHAPWVVRAVAAHEVGHLRARHIERTRWLALGVSVAVGVLLWSIPAPWWIGAPLFLSGIFACDRWAVGVLRSILYRSYEVEADVWAVRAGALMLRFRFWAAATDRSAAYRRIHVAVLRAVERRTR